MKTDGVAATWTDGAAAVSWTEAVKLELQLPDGSGFGHQQDIGGGYREPPRTNHGKHVHRIPLYCWQK